MSIRSTGIVCGLLTIVTTVLVAVAGYGVAQVEAQGPPAVPGKPTPIVLRRWVAVAHTKDYMAVDFLHGHNWERWKTFVNIHGINGTDQVARVGTYVLGEGQLWASQFKEVPPGQHDRLLNVFHFGGDQGGTTGFPPPYVGEVIVVVSNEPLIVTGDVTRGFNDFVEHASLRMNTAMSRTLEVHQYNCADPADRSRVAQFCRFSSAPTR